MHADSGGFTGLTPSQLAKQRRKRTGARRLFADESSVSAGLMRPGLVTRISDKVVSLFARFEGDEPEPVINQDPAWKSPVRMVLAWTTGTAAYMLVGRRDQALLFFGTQAALLIGAKAWFDWHKRNPPAKDAGSVPGGILRALLHAVGAFTVGLAYCYVLERSIPMLAENSNGLWGLEVLVVSSTLAVLAYQRRTGWKQDDPERLLIIGVVAVAFAALVSVVQIFL